MKNISINIEEVPRSTERYSIGYAGESNATTVTFVATAWREAYPNGVFSLLIKRPDDYCYPCAISEQGGIVTYLVSAADVSIHGFGKLELQSQKTMPSRRAPPSTSALRRALEKEALFLLKMLRG